MKVVLWMQNTKCFAVKKFTKKIFSVIEVELIGEILIGRTLFNGLDLVFLCFANNFFFTIVVASKCKDNQSSTIISQKSVQTKRTKYRSTFGWKFFFVQLCIYIFLLNYVLKCVISIFFGQNKMTDCDWLFL